MREFPKGTLCIAFALALAGCGQMGGLYLPGEDSPPVEPVVSDVVSSSAEAQAAAGLPAAEQPAIEPTGDTSADDTETAP